VGDGEALLLGDRVLNKKDKTSKAVRVVSAKTKKEGERRGVVGNSERNTEEGSSSKRSKMEKKLKKGDPNQ